MAENGDLATPGPRIELLWWRECPSWERALAELREEIAALGLDPDAVEVREVATTEAAEREEFVGSPTIRIDGRDVQPPSGDPVGLACRTYLRRDGRVSPLPDRADVRDALAGASVAGGHER
ncbi:MAG TPA: hypothetical protein VE401_06465 [Solirubrobacterales bacterium]|jgi:hypothetical protein|nr:hypothetical protein [Solirubrobacterales bacterium]